MRGGGPGERLDKLLSGVSFTGPAFNFSVNGGRYNVTSVSKHKCGQAFSEKVETVWDHREDHAVRAPGSVDMGERRPAAHATLEEKKAAKEVNRGKAKIREKDVTDVVAKLKGEGGVDRSGGGGLSGG